MIGDQLDDGVAKLDQRLSAVNRLARRLPNSRTRYRGCRPAYRAVSTE
ncbi:hypothetical protein BZL30_0023 [Mycobacterium kansasii]|uniref:Uncharacterized protein n=1 Tax=Mycobacterium kansasii TaxID=1768 RepID=A0A1V3XT27_MYCKA|nr:hypothetical protein BZL30_0023 [Mycobacterium kansasii]